MRLVAMHAAVFLKRHRVAAAIIGLLVALLIVAALILSFGWIYLRGPLEQRLSSQFGRPVTIGAIDRIDHGLLHPVLRIGDVRVAQPAWVGGGNMIVVRSAVVRLPLLPLFLGRVRLQSVEADELTIALIREAGGRANWNDLPGGSKKGGRGSLQHLLIRNGVLTLDDRKHDHRLTTRFGIDDRSLHLAGTGSLAGRPSTIAITGAPVVGSGAWPFRLDYRSAIASGTLVGRADHPLDLAHFAAHATAWGDDLREIDRLIDVGLPGTQHVRLTTDVRHDGTTWTIRKLALDVGRSNIAGDFVVTKSGDRTKVDGAIVSTGLDFDDITSSEGLARAAIRRRQLGPRLFPETQIHLENLQRLDGTLRFDVKHLLFKQPSTFRAMRGTAVLDHGVLTVRPLVVALAQGRLTGTALVRHQSGTPRLTLDLHVTGARLEAILGETASGAMAARIHVQGDGRTVRAAIGDATGTIGVVGRNGAVTRRAALLLGSDAGRALFENKTDKTRLRCLVAHFVTKSGIATAAPLVLDTDVSRTEGTGTIDLASERIGLTLTGQPKLAHAARLHIPIVVDGTLSDPHIRPKSVPKNAGTMLKLLGSAIAGGHSEPAPDADCEALSAQALR